MSIQVIAFREDPEAELIDAIVLQRRRWRRSLIEWWGGYATGPISRSVSPEDVLEWDGWRTLALELPEDWQEGYLRAAGGTVEFVYGRQPEPDLSQFQGRQGRRAWRREFRRATPRWFWVSLILFGVGFGLLAVGAALRIRPVGFVGIGVLFIAWALLEFKSRRRGP
jgi:hypothetical protein